MGHVRLGRLPSTREWKQVVALLMDGDVSYGAIAEASAAASEEALSSLTGNPAFIEAMYLLCRIPQAARAPDFQAALRELGVHVRDNPSLPELASGIARAMEHTVRMNRIPDDLGDLLSKAAISSFTSMVQAAAPGLWNPNPEDVRHAVSHFASPQHFSSLAQEFCARFIQRHLRYYLDREMPRHLGYGQYLPSMASWQGFNQAMEMHAQESSTIMRVFAREWYGKKYLKQEEITRDNVKGFSHIVLKKMRSELQVRRETSDATA